MMPGQVKQTNVERISKLLEKSLMVFTALVPQLGYDKRAQIAQLALKKCDTLSDEAITGGFITAEEFDKMFNPKRMFAPN